MYRLKYSLSILSMMMCFCAVLTAQRIDMPDGEAMVTVNTLNASTTVRLTATRSTVYSSKLTAGEWSKGKALFQTNPLRRIVDAHLKYDGIANKRDYVLLLDDGTTIVFSYDIITETFANANGQVIDPPQVQGQQQFRKVLLGKEMYLQYGSTFFRNLLDGSPWKQDTAGLNRANVQDISLGMHGALIAGTNRGVFGFSTATSDWSRFSSFDSATSATTVFVTRNDRFYAGTANKGTFLSNDDGASWVLDTTGLGNSAVARFGDDNSNTVYITVTLQGNTSALLRKTDNSSPWERIDEALKNLITLQPRINDIGGAPTLEVATNYGNFSSTDKGNTWIVSVKGIMAEDISGVQFLANNITLVSTAFGIFRKEGSADWTKVYPQTGYLGGRPLYRGRNDNPLNLCTQLAAANGQQGAIIATTDGGQTWQADTTGLSAVPGSGGGLAPVFYVDAGGVRHIGIASTQSQPLRVYSAKPVWAIDTVGMGLYTAGNQTEYCAALHNDLRTMDEYVSGAIFAQQGAINDVLMFKRAVGGKWGVDTTGLGRTVLLSMVSDKKNLYGGTALIGGSASIFQKTANGWTSIPAPPAAISDTRAMTIDSAGVLYVAYSPVLNTNAPNRGVYATTDNGKTWEYAGLDSVTIRGLTATSDAAYAYTNRGTYKLSRQTLKAASVQLSRHVINFDTLGVTRTRDTMVTITNTGDDTLRVTNLRTGSQSFSATPTQFNLAPGASRQITVTFSPKSIGQLVTTLRTVSNTLPDTIQLVGEGIAPNNAKLSFFSRILVFLDVPVGTSRDSSGGIRNEGTDTIHVTNIISTNPVFTVLQTQFDVPPKEMREFPVRFSPKNIGANNGTLRVLSNTLPDSMGVTGNSIVASVSEEAMAEKMQLRVSPNPTSEGINLRLQLSRDENITITLVNIMGQEVTRLYEGTINSGEQSLHFDLQSIEGLTSGVYYCRVHTQQGIGGVKLVIER